MKEFLKTFLPPIFFLAICLIGLELAVRSEVIASFLCPAPSQVYAAFVEFLPDLLQALRGTAEATLEGLLLSFIIGQLLALVFGLSAPLRRAVFPIAVFFQTVPIIAIAPLLVIWFGFGLPTVRASAMIVSFFPILSNAMVGLETASRESRELFQVLGASPLQTLWKLRVPSGIQTSFAGLRVAAGLAVVGALVGEFVGGGGLGALIDSARTQQRVDLVFACVLLSALLGLLFLGFVLLIESFVKKWRPFQD